MKIVTIIGARPQFIKAAPFSKEFRKENTEILVHTGQHYDENMSQIFFDELGIPKPDYNLNVGSASHAHQTAAMLTKIEDIIFDEKPDALLVYGDTNSTIAGSLAASKLNLPVFHIEAGLRSYNKKMPEEQNRVLTDHISTFLFCPTNTAVDNLKKESIYEGVYQVGDIMYDAVLKNIDIATEKYKCNWKECTGIQDVEIGKYILATVHRAENTDDIDKLRIIFEALNSLSQTVIMPLHPRTKKIVQKYQLLTDNIHIIEPVGYLLMLFLVKNASMIVTDSGGLQKEAYFLRTPCTTLRTETEWIETLNFDWNMLCDIEKLEIINKVTRNVSNLGENYSNSFGNGDTSEIICSILNRHYSKTSI